MKQRFFVLVAAVMLVGATLDASATSSGIIRRATLNTNGCGNSACHGGSASANTTLSIKEAVDGRISAMRGETVSLTLRIENAGQVAAGCNISVKTEENGATNAGALKDGEGSGLRVFVGELTQSFPKNFENGVVEFQFEWTAPDEDGTFYLHGIGNAVNRNGSNDAGDDWAWMQPIEIVVGNEVSVNELAIDHSSARISPMPAHGAVTIHTPVIAGETVIVRIMDSRGSLVRTESVSTTSDQLVYVWDGRNSIGGVVSPGQYSVAVIGSRKVYTAKAILVH